jgi:hypothetical protein
MSADVSMYGYDSRSRLPAIYSLHVLSDSTGPWWHCPQAADIAAAFPQARTGEEEMRLDLLTDP